MAVEARHRNLFPSQYISNSAIEGNMNVYNTYGLLPPLSGTTTESLVPQMYNSAVADSFTAKAAVKADSGLTYAHHLPVPRKRSRDSMISPMMTFCNGDQIQSQNGGRCGSGGSIFTFLGDDVSLQIQQQQLEMDRLVTQHTEKVRMEIEERRKQYSRRIIAVFEEGISKRLKAKEDEIEKIAKINWALEEKLKSLYMENQIWRDLAQTNEATANALRSNLEQVLTAQLNDEQAPRGVASAVDDDAQSCCGSNYEGEAEVEKGGGDQRRCKHCGEWESCVLLLPCRHLCLCTVCGSSVHTCPICKTPKNASVHVIMSST